VLHDNQKSLIICSRIAKSTGAVTADCVASSRTWPRQSITSPALATHWQRDVVSHGGSRGRVAVAVVVHVQHA
jgi:hypothetical protein